MVAIAATSDSRQSDSDDDFHDTAEDAESLKEIKVPHQQETSSKGKTLSMPPVRYFAKLFWPHGQLPNCFKVDVFYFQNIPTEIYKVYILFML